MELKHLSLFSGIGGIDIAAEWAGFKTVGQVEWAEYQTKVLEKHWPAVERWKDVRDFRADEFIRKTGVQEVTVLSGGGSLANLIALQESVSHLMMSGICGQSTGELLAKLNQDGLWLKMYEDYLQVRMDGSFLEFSEICPTWGTMRHGVLIRQLGQVPFIGEKEFLLLPTPQASDGTSWSRVKKSDCQMSLYRYGKNGHQKKTIHYIQFQGVSIIRAAELYEMMMGFPVGWTELNA